MATLAVDSFLATNLIEHRVLAGRRSNPFKGCLRIFVPGEACGTDKKDRGAA
jgi:hypothetical protein